MQILSNSENDTESLLSLDRTLASHTDMVVCRLPRRAVSLPLSDSFQSSHQYLISLFTLPKGKGCASFHLLHSFSDA